LPCRRSVPVANRTMGSRTRERSMGPAILWSALATGTLLIGMVLAYRGVVSLRWTGLTMAFGAGAIISAVAYQLVLPAAIESQASELTVGVAILIGALTFYFADKWVD